MLQKETGVSGEIDVTVRAKDITDPKVISWMSRFQESTLKAAGYKEGARCAQEKDPPELCPALSLPTLLRTVDASDQRQVAGLLDAVPEYFSQGVVTRDRTTANLAFGIRLQSLEDQKKVVGGILLDISLNVVKFVCSRISARPKSIRESWKRSFPT